MRVLVVRAKLKLVELLTFGNHICPEDLVAGEIPGACGRERQ